MRHTTDAVGSDSVPECFCLQARRAARILSRHYDEVFAQFDLTNGQYSILRILTNNREIGFQGLADGLVTDRTTLTSAMKPLQRRGLVTISVDPRDKRARLIAVTAAGRALLRRATPAWQYVQDELAKRVGPQGVRNVFAALHVLAGTAIEASRSASTAPGAD